ncbi:MAG: DNA repair protein RadA [Cyanophyceae cyanobacterium]
MGKVKTRHVCNACGAESPQWFGRCPACGAWGSLIEEVVPTAVDSGPVRAGASPRSRGSGPSVPARALAAQPLAAVTLRSRSRLPSGFGELDRVLGGGLVPGSLVLVGGDPGIGKSTLLLQTARSLATRSRVLYVCAEESAQQVKLRAMRLGTDAPDPSDQDPDSEPELELDPDLGPESEPRSRPIPNAAPQDLYLLAETNLDLILAELEALRPSVAVIDSIQAIYLPAMASAPGSVAQVRECTAALMRVAKRSDTTLLIVGHVTKEGAIAGPKVLEHLVDTVLYFEGDRFASFRLLRSVKNRFGATHELGVFEMADVGLREVRNPSALFLGGRDGAVSGTAAIVACEGTRPIVAEIQALVSPTSYSSPRRTATGIGHNRLLQILAVLEKRVGVPLSRLDAYVSTSGGLTVEEPAADLGVAVALVASFRDRLVDPHLVSIGEVGLGGQIRPVSQLEVRLKEAAKLGFTRALIPKGTPLRIRGMELIPVTRLVDAIATALAGAAIADPPPDRDRPPV